MSQKSNVEIIIAGSGPRVDELKQLSANLTNLKFIGWLNGKDVQLLLSISTFGLVPYWNTKNYRLNLPNKFSEYLAGGLAIACGLDGEMAALTKNNNIGFVYDERDYRQLASKLHEFSKDSDLVVEMQNRASELHGRLFDEEVVYPMFADYLEYVVSERVE